MSVESNAPFFIVGSGRSGTTLLRMILASHSRLSIPPETWYLNKLTAFLDINRPLAAEEVHTVVTVMTDHYRWPDFKFDAEDFRRQVAALTSPHLRDILELVYRHQLERDQKVRWGDKTPGYIELVPQLAQIFGGAQFIHLIRDGRDVARSFQAMTWYGRRLHDNAREWIEAMSCGDRWSRSPLAGQFLQVRYEDLVLEPETTVRRVCTFLGEPFEPQMLSWRNNVEKLVPTREAKIHEKLKQIPTAADVYRWKREMSAREILVCEAFMGSYLEAHGYELKFKGALWKPLSAFTRWYCERALPKLSLLPKALRFFRQRFSSAPASGQGDARVQH